MTEQQTCPCGRPANNSYLCATCTARLTNIFPTIADLWRQLEIRMTKERGVDYRGRGGSRSSEPPAVITDNVTKLRTEVRASIYGAAADLAEAAPFTAPVLALRDTTPYRCIVLHQYAGHLARSESAPRLLHALELKVDELTRKIDTPPGRVYVGRCNGIALARVAQPREKLANDVERDVMPCGRDLYVPEDGRHALATVECSDCGLTYSLKELHAYALAGYRGKLVTRAEGMELLGINRNTLDSWIRRKRILPRGAAGDWWNAELDDRKLYLVDELMELARDRKDSAA